MSLTYVHMTVTAAEAKAQQVSISEKEFTHFIQAFHSFDIWQADRRINGQRVEWRCNYETTYFPYPSVILVSMTFMETKITGRHQELRSMLSARCHRYLERINTLRSENNL